MSRYSPKAFLLRRLGDAALVLAWLVVLFNVVQLTRIDDDETTGRIVFSYAVMLGLGVAATVLWARARSRRRR